jgi:hypothetical protein
VSTPAFLIGTNGRIVLADFRRAEAFIVSQAGELLERTGGKGAGPGEYRSMFNLEWCRLGQEFWLQDNDLLRITRYSVDGQLIGNFNYGDRLPVNAYYQSLGDGRFACAHEVLDGTNRETEWWFADDRLNRIYSFPETLDPAAYWEGKAGAVIPYPAMKTLWISVFSRFALSDSDNWRLTVFNASSEPLYRLEREWEPTPISAVEKREIRRMWRDDFGGHWLEYWDKIPIPDQRPPFASITFDDRGRIWAEYYEGPYSAFLIRAESYRYDIFSAEGVWLGTQVLPFNRIHVQDGYLYHTYHSEAGAPRLERLQIVPLVPELEWH